MDYHSVVTRLFTLGLMKGVTTRDRKVSGRYFCFVFNGDDMGQFH